MVPPTNRADCLDGFLSWVVSPFVTRAADAVVAGSSGGGWRNEGFLPARQSESGTASKTV